MGLSITKLSVQQGGKAVLNNVTARFSAGRICAVLGPNGAGKSTLLKAIAQLIPLATGEIRMGDEPLAAMDARERARNIAYLPQQSWLAWDILVRDVVALGRHPHGDSDRAAIEAAMTATDTLQLAERLTGGLSGGELARVMLARVLAGQPDWILADEPLASLDPAYQLDLAARLRATADAGAAILLVVHDVNLAARITDDVLMLKGGKIHAAGPAADTLTEEHLSALYDVPVTRLPASDVFSFGAADHTAPIL